MATIPSNLGCDHILAFFDLINKFFLEYLLVLTSLVGSLLYLFEVHVERLSVALYLLHSLDDLFLKNLLTLFHFMNSLVQRFVFIGGRSTTSVFG